MVSFCFLMGIHSMVSFDTHLVELVIVIIISLVISICLPFGVFCILHVYLVHLFQAFLIYLHFDLSGTGGWMSLVI